MPYDKDCKDSTIEKHFCELCETLVSFLKQEDLEKYEKAKRLKSMYYGNRRMFFELSPRESDRIDLCKIPKKSRNLECKILFSYFPKENSYESDGKGAWQNKIISGILENEIMKRLDPFKKSVYNQPEL